MGERVGVYGFRADRIISPLSLFVSVQKESLSMFSTTTVPSVVAIGKASNDEHQATGNDSGAHTVVVVQRSVHTKNSGKGLSGCFNKKEILKL